MTPEQIRAAQIVGKALLDTIAESAPLGAPSGPMYAALMTQGCTLSQYQSITQSMLRNELVTAENDPQDGTPVLFHITAKGQAFREKLASRL